MSKYVDSNGLSTVWQKVKSTFANIDDGMETIKGTQAAATNAWTGVSKQSSLYDGMKIAYYLTYAGNGNAATLNLTLADGTTTGAKNIRAKNNSTITTHMAPGSMIYMTYFTSVNYSGTTVTNTWWIQGWYDTNDLYRNSVYNPGIKTGSNGLMQYSLCMVKSDDTLESFTTTNGIGTSKTINTSGFKLGKMFMWWNSNNLAAGVVPTAGNQLWSYWTTPLDVRYSLNCGQTLTANKPIYIVGTYTDGLFYLSSPTYWAQTLPSNEDGKLYIYAGQAHDSYRIVFLNEHPAYWYKDGAIREFTYYKDTTYSAGTGLSLSGITFNHSNSVTAQTTQAVYPIKIDSQGHISAYGSAVTIPGDTKVTQTSISTNGNYPVILKKTANATQETNNVNATNLTSGTAVSINPSTGNLNVVKINGVDVGSSPKFTDTTALGSMTGTLAVAHGGTGATDAATARTNLGAAAASHTHSNIVTAGDNRTVATTPNDYSNKLIFQGLKTSSTIGNPSTDTYSYLIGLRGWSDSSGGNSQELAFNNTGLYLRNGATTSWNAWKKIATTSDIPTVNNATLTIQKNGTTVNTFTANASSNVTANIQITDTDVTDALGYTPYDADNPDGYTTNTGTVTSVSVSNATNGGLSVSGSPITSSGTITVGHSNVLTNAQTTQAVYPIKIDKNGHVSAYGTAVTIGVACAKGVTDNSSSTAVTSTDTNLITGRTLYYAGYTKNTGTMTGPSSATENHVATFGSSKTVLKDSGYTIGKSVPSNAVFTDTHNSHALTITNGTATATSGEITYVESATAGSASSGNIPVTMNRKKVTVPPTYQYSTTDLTPGTSTLATGTLYFVYE